MEKRKISISLSNGISFAALFISILSIYFSVFYENHDMTVSLIDSDVVYSGNSISVDLLYHNHGNTHSTVIENHLVFYQSKDWANEGIIFENGKHVFELGYDPEILVPGEQRLRKLETLTDFENLDTRYRSLKLDEIVSVGLVATYINQHGLMTSEMLPIGEIKLNNDNQIIKYSLDYDVFNLNSDSHFLGEEIK